MAVALNDWRVQAYLDWLCTPLMDRDPPTQGEFAETIQVERHTLKNWRNDGDFLGAWEKKYRQTVGSPERVKNVFDALYDTAKDRTDPRHVQAADKYLHAVDAVKPQQIDVHVSGSAKELTDDQLAELIAVRAEKELNSRARTEG